MSELKCKYYKLVKQVSYDSGQTWISLDEYMRGDLYESGSTDCATPQCDPIFRWNDNYFCVDGDKYTTQKCQVSYNCGVTWEDVNTSASTRTRLYKFMVCDCNWVSPYQIGSGYTYDEECPECVRTYWEIKCEEGRKYKISVSQYSTDNWETWEDGTSSNQTLQVETCECGNSVIFVPMTDNDKVYVDSLPSRSIPESVGCDGRNYVDKNDYTTGFKTQSNSNFVAVGTCVERIESGTLGYWEKLEKLVLPSTINYIGSQQIKGTFKTLVLTSKIPPILKGSGTWPSTHPFPTYYVSTKSSFDSAEKIYVPNESIDLYKSDGRWSLNVPIMSTQKPYLWTFTYVRNDSGGGQLTTPRMLNKKGTTISSITDYYLANTSYETPSLSDSGWTTTPELPPSTLAYVLWNYKVIIYDDGTEVIINPSKLYDGYLTHIDGVASYYLSSPHFTGVDVNDSSWSIFADKIIGYTME